MTIPATYKSDVEKAVEILSELGCTEVYVFGSVAEGTYTTDSDIDIAVRGCPADRFFTAVGTLMMNLDHSLDLIDLERDRDFARHLLTHEDIIRVA
jgi:predicted nucleotidyltransferase